MLRAVQFDHIVHLHHLQSLWVNFGSAQVAALARTALSACAQTLALAAKTFHRAHLSALPLAALILADRRVEQHSP